MGYYSYHSLTVYSTNSNDVDAFAEAMKSYRFPYGVPFGYYFQIKPDFYDASTYLFDFGNEAKWYDMEKDMCALSNLFPSLTFMVHRDGETFGDCEEITFEAGFICKRERLNSTAYLILVDDEVECADFMEVYDEDQYDDAVAKAMEYVSECEGCAVFVLKTDYYHPDRDYDAMDYEVVWSSKEDM